MTGEKIKNLRRGLGLTQAEIAGEEITRNMLSQIENGVANPSISTLTYLAKKLNVPVEYLISETDDLSAFMRISKRKSIDDAFCSGEYEKCLKLLGDANDSEGKLLACMCCFALGKASFEKCELLSSTEYFEKCVALSEGSPFACAVADSAKRYIAISSAILGREKTSITADVADYAMAINEKSSVAQRHLEARSLMAQGKYSDAEKKLGTLFSEAKQIGAVCEFYILTDLETCLKHTGDYERAYACAEQRMELKNLMTK